jgi:transposase
MRCTEVVNILEIMRLGEMGLSQREIAASLNCGKTTVGEVRKRCSDAELTYAQASGMTGIEIMERLYPGKEVPSEKPPPDWESVHKWLKGGKRRNLQYAWEEYRRSTPGGLGYSQFCRRYKAWKDSTGKTVTMAQDHAPGDKVFIDWVGDTLDCVIDPSTGEVLTAHFFVAVLGYSWYPYAEAFPNEQLECWLTANIHALEYFGGVPRTGVPDNTTTAVTKPHYYDPKLNPAYLGFSQHYGIAIIPARPYRPKDKSPAEGSVGWLETWLLEWLRDQQFFSFAELNSAIKMRLESLVERKFQKRIGSRKSEFEDVEKHVLRPLPPTRYDLAQYVTRTVPDNYHIDFDGYYYSVPYTLYTQVVTMRATSTIVEIVNNNRERVALHERRYIGSRYVTAPEHMPERHRRQAEASRRTGADYLAWSETIGCNTQALIERMLKAQTFEETAYRSCMGVLQFSKKYTPAELEVACGRALEVGSPNYTTVKNLLQNPPLKKRPQPLPQHENLRNPAEFS